MLLCAALTYWHFKASGHLYNTCQGLYCCIAALLSCWLLMAPFTHNEHMQPAITVLLWLLYT